MTMHSDQFHIDDNFIRELLASEAPDWAHLSIRRLTSSGTDNAIFRLGDAHFVRIPVRPSAIAPLEKELDWLPHLAGLPLAVSKVIDRGRAALDNGTRIPFGILEWIEGEIATPDKIADQGVATEQLAQFLKALRNIDTEDAPPAGRANHDRGIALSGLDDKVRSSIEILKDEIDDRLALTIWDNALAAGSSEVKSWLHGDLKADNMIAHDGKLGGIIDWGLAAVGDPSADYAVAWGWIDDKERARFRALLQLDDNDWLRAQGWALYNAVIALSYYRGGKNEALCRHCRMMLSRLGLMR